MALPVLFNHTAKRIFKGAATTVVGRGADDPTVDQLRSEAWARVVRETGLTAQP